MSDFSCLDCFRTLLRVVLVIVNIFISVSSEGGKLGNGEHVYLCETTIPCILEAFCNQIDSSIIKYRCG